MINFLYALNSKLHIFLQKQSHFSVSYVVFLSAIKHMVVIIIYFILLYIYFTQNRSIKGHWAFERRWKNFSFYCQCANSAESPCHQETSTGPSHSETICCLKSHLISRFRGWNILIQLYNVLHHEHFQKILCYPTHIALN